MVGSFSPCRIERPWRAQKDQPKGEEDTRGVGHASRAIMIGREETGEVALSDVRLFREAIVGEDKKEKDGSCKGGKKTP